MNKRNDQKQPATPSLSPTAYSSWISALLFVCAISLIGTVASEVRAATKDDVSCAQIRARIDVPPSADPNLLRQMAARRDCGFTTAEAYRAAYGRPLPPPEYPWRRRQHRAAGHDH